MGSKSTWQHMLEERERRKLPKNVLRLPRPKRTACEDCGRADGTVSNVYWAGAGEYADPTPLCNGCKKKAGIDCMDCLDSGNSCQACCDHKSSGFDHDICIDCGYERDPGEAIDRAMDRWEDR